MKGGSSSNFTNVNADEVVVEVWPDETTPGKSPFVKLPKTPVSDKRKYTTLPTAPALAEQCPLQHANIFESMFMTWLTPMFNLGFYKPIDEADVWKLADRDTCKNLTMEFEKHWLKHKRLGIAIVSMFRFQFLLSALLMVLYIVISYCQPYFIQSLLSGLTGKPRKINPPSEFWLPVGITCLAFLKEQLKNNSFIILSRIGINARSIVMSLIHEKILKVPIDQSNNGNILTLMSVDSERFLDAITYINWLWVSPILMCTSMVFVSFQLNSVSALVGAAVLMLVSGISLWLAYKIKSIRKEILLITQERVKLSAEILHGIRMVKYNGWEDYMSNRVNDIRAEEVLLLKRFHFLRVLSQTFVVLTVLLATATCFLTYFWLGNNLFVSQVFTTIAFINAFKSALSFFPKSSISLGEALAASDRIEAFLFKATEIGNAVHHRSDSNSIDIQNADFCRIEGNNDKLKNSEPCLSNISCNIPEGSLTMIVGEVGSGKSTFFDALLGEVHCTSGRISIGSNISYLQEDPLIIHGTIRENIIMNEIFDSKLYFRVIDVVKLGIDFQTLPAGDMTEVGQNGENLSGGQKSRISFARILYRQNAEIVLLDDPLRSVDSKTANSLAHVIKNWNLATNAPTMPTRLMIVGKNYELLPFADQVLVFSEKRIIGNGAYDRLIKDFPFLRSTTDHPDSPQSLGMLNGQENSCVSPMKSSRGEEEIGFFSSSNGNLLTVEDRFTGLVKVDRYMQYFQQYGRIGKYLPIIVPILFAVSMGCRTLVDWWIGQWADEEAKKESETGYYATIYIIIVASTGTLIFSSSFFFILVTVKVSKVLHDSVFGHVLRLQVNKFFDINPVGRILNRFTRDLDQIDYILPDIYIQCIRSSCFVISAIILSLFSTEWVLVVWVPVSIIYILLVVVYQRTAREVKRLENIGRTQIQNSFSSTILGIKTIRAHNITKQCHDSTEQSIDSSTRLYLAYWMGTWWLSLRTDYISSSIVSGMTFLIVILKDSIDPALAGTTITYSFLLPILLKKIAEFSAYTDNLMTSVERLLFLKSFDGENNQYICKEKLTCHQTGTITFKNVSFRYRPGLKLALENINFTIHQGEKVGIIGRSGAGKSSILACLFRLVDINQGTICVNGKDISHMDTHELRSKIAIVPQEPVVFSGTVREQIDPFQHATETQIWSALDKVGLKKKIVDLGGITISCSLNFSSGEKRLLCMAGIILKKVNIVALDEVISMSNPNEKEEAASVLNIFDEKVTVLCISHHMSDLSNFDRIVIVDNGRIVKFESPEKTNVQIK